MSQKFISVPISERKEVLNSDNVVTSGMPLPDGDYTAKVSDVGKFLTKKNNVLMTFKGTLTDGENVYTFENKKFVVITDSLVWSVMEAGKSYDVTTRNRRIESIDEKE